jgi:zona occludens toxin (predicted ATPase)
VTNEKKLYRFAFDQTRVSQFSLLSFLQVTLAGSFYPNYFVPKEIEEKDAWSDLMGSDPRTSVVFRSVPPNAEQYADQIVSHIRSVSSHVKLSFQASKYVLYSFSRDFASPGAWTMYTKVKVIFPASFVRSWCQTVNAKIVTRFRKYRCSLP